jgi:hypothetical protein
MTVVLLTDAESRLVRKVLEHPGIIVEPESAPLEAFNRGVARGTAKPEQKRRKGK